MYAININVYALRAAGLRGKIGLQDIAILDYIHKFANSGSAVMQEGRAWINIQNMINQIGFLDAENKSNISRRVKKLEELGLLEGHRDFTTRRLFLKTTKHYSDIVDWDINPNMDQEFTPADQDFAVASAQRWGSLRERNDGSLRQRNDVVASTQQQDPVIATDSESLRQRNDGVVASTQPIYVNNKNTNNKDITAEEKAQKDLAEKSGLITEPSDYDPFGDLTQKAVSENIDMGKKAKAKSKNAVADLFENEKPLLKPQNIFNKIDMSEFIAKGIDPESMKSWLMIRAGKKVHTDQGIFRRNMDAAVEFAKTGLGTATDAVNEAADRGWAKIDVNWLKNAFEQKTTEKVSQFPQNRANDAFNNDHGFGGQTRASTDEEIEAFFAQAQNTA